MCTWFSGRHLGHKNRERHISKAPAGRKSDQLDTSGPEELGQMTHLEDAEQSQWQDLLRASLRLKVTIQNTVRQSSTLEGLPGIHQSKERVFFFFFLITTQFRPNSTWSRHSLPPREKSDFLFTSGHLLVPITFHQKWGQGPNKQLLLSPFNTLIYNMMNDLLNAHHIGVSYRKDDAYPPQSVFLSGPHLQSLYKLHSRWQHDSDQVKTVCSDIFGSAKYCLGSKRKWKRERKSGGNQINERNIIRERKRQNPWRSPGQSRGKKTSDKQLPTHGEACLLDISRKPSPKAHVQWGHDESGGLASSWTHKYWARKITPIIS